MYTVSGIFYTKKKVTEHLLLRTRSVYRNVGKKSQEKKSRKKSQIWVGKKVTGKKVTKKNYAFSQLLDRNNIFIFIIPLLSLYVLFGLMFKPIYVPLNNIRSFRN